MPTMETPSDNYRVRATRASCSQHRGWCNQCHLWLSFEIPKFATTTSTFSGKSRGAMLWDLVRAGWGGRTWWLRGTGQLSRHLFTCSFADSS